MTPLRPVTKGVGVMPLSFSRLLRASASRRTFTLKPPQKPLSLVTMRTAALVGCSFATVSGWSMLPVLLTTPVTARMISRSYGTAACIRCCAFTMRDEAMSS